MLEVERDGLPLLLFQLFTECSETVCAVTTRFTSSGHEFNLSLNSSSRTEEVIRNRLRLLRTLCPTANQWVSCQQVHSDNVRVVGKDELGRGFRPAKSPIPETDALITLDRDVPLALSAADCPLVLIYEPAIHLICVVHSGWRGVLKCIVQKALCEVSKLGGNSEECLVAISPCICKDCYEVREDFADTLRRTWSEGEEFLHSEGGELRFDLASAIVRQLLSSGVQPDNIEVAGLCTKESESLYSYRRDGEGTGAFYALLMLTTR